MALVRDSSSRDAHVRPQAATVHVEPFRRIGSPVPSPHLRPYLPLAGDSVIVEAKILEDATLE